MLEVVCINKIDIVRVRIYCLDTGPYYTATGPYTIRNTELTPLSNKTIPQNEHKEPNAIIPPPPRRMK
jgi:hypothetical protein